MAMAVFYNFAYLSFMSDLFWLYFGTNKEEIDELEGYQQGLGDMILELVIAYNLFLSIPNFVINLIVIIKEM